MSKVIAEISAWMVEAYYHEIGFKLWNVSRYYRLCKRLRCLPEELRMVLRIEAALYGNYVREDKFPGAVSLHFEIIERWLNGLEGKESVPVLPIHIIMHESEPTLPQPEDNLPDTTIT